MKTHGLNVDTVLSIPVPVVDPERTLQPERYGRYVLLDRIAEGGMAEVFRAVMPGVEGFKRTFVIKRILGHLSQSPRFVEMFVREARICALLNHPNAVQVYDFGLIDGHYFLAMEYLRGYDVLAILRQVRRMKLSFPVSVATFIAREVASCLGYAHALRGADGQPLGIVHRDVSPSNIMCLREGGVKLLDFGIASAVSEIAKEQTEQGAFKGKLAYVAPERMRNEPLDGRSDLYSLGVVLWEMLTCRRLFRGTNEAETFKNLMEMPIPPPSALRPEVPFSLDTIVLKMLERDSSRRYQTGQALADDLEEVLRETQYHSRQLPSMLVDVFGPGTHSSQIAVSMVAPELLATEPTGSGSGVGRTPSTSTAITSRWRAWRLWAVVVAAAGVLATMLLWGLQSPPPSARTEAASVRPTAKAPDHPPAGTAEAPVVSATQVTPQPTAAIPSDDTQKQVEHAGPTDRPARAKSTKTLPRKRVGHAQGDDALDAIAKGRSIDPFAEASRRGHP